MLRKIMLLLAVMSGMTAWLSGQAAKQRAPVVRQVDQILVNSNNPQSLFRLLSETLQLPVVWQLAENQQYTSGAVSTGNLTIEIFRYAGKNQPPKSRISGLVFEPYPLSYVLKELKYLGLPHGEPEPSIGALPKGTKGVQWTRVGLTALSNSFSVFLYEYSPAFLKVDVRRKQLGNRLMLNSGGPLGVVSAKEIVISCRQIEKQKAAWELLLGKADQSGVFHVGAGPSVRLVPGDEDAILDLALRVKSPEHAGRFLKANRLSGPQSAGSLALDPAKLAGLKIRLVR